MGLRIGQKNIELERRYRRLDIQKDMQSDNVLVYIHYEDGYYDEGLWHATESQTLEVRGDAANLLMGLTTKQLKIPPSGLGHFLDAAVYALLSGKVATRSRLAVTVKDRKDKPLAASISVSKGQHLYAQAYGAEAAFDLPVLLDATLKVEAEGYNPQTIPLRVLSGDVAQNVVLESLAEEEAT